MSEQPDHIRAFRAALEAEGFEPGKIARVELSDIMDIWWEGTVPWPSPPTIEGKPPGVHVANEWGSDWPTPPVVPAITAEEWDKLKASLAYHGPLLSGIDKALAMAQAVLDALEAADAAKDAANPRPKPTESARPATEATPPGWMARIGRWIAEFGRFLAFRRAS